MASLWIEWQVARADIVKSSPSIAAGWRDGIYSRGP